MSGSLGELVFRVRDGVGALVEDSVAVERPLEIRGWWGGEARVISTTMRTPGEDRALAAGFLYAERVIASAAWLRKIQQVDDDAVVVEFAPTHAAEAEAALQATARQFVTSGACGVCGRVNLDALMRLPGDDEPSGAAKASSNAAPAPAHPLLSAAVVHALPASLRKAQATFDRTGGLHAAGLFTAADGTLRALHEDVGRHNAVDKLVGTLLLKGSLVPRALAAMLLMVSGRASFELVQKAAVAGFPVLAAVGAPSSLAVELARRAGMTLLGFVRDSGFNVYCGLERLTGVSRPGS